MMRKERSGRRFMMALSATNITLKSIVMKKINRRDFLGYTGSVLAFTVIPRRALGGPGFVAPNDKINLGLIGVGTQQLGELTRLIPDERVQVVSVCDPNKYPIGYLQWSADNGLKKNIRDLIGDAGWGGDVNVTAGRECGQDFINKYYAKTKGIGGYNGCTAYADFREMLEKENGIDAVKIVVPDHAYPAIIIHSLRKKRHVVAHKPLGVRVHEVRAVINEARKHPDIVTHLLAWSPIHERYETVKKWIDDGVIGELREIHNWSFRPVWQQWQSYFTEYPEIPKGFDWDLWLGAWPNRPYHPGYTHTNYRGWYDFGAGSIADMGIYSLLPLFRTFGIDAPPYSIDAMGTTTRTVGEKGEMIGVTNDVAFPLSSVIRWKFDQTTGTTPFDLFWYDGGMRPSIPPEIEMDNKELDSEGMMFVGDEGKIIGGFLCENPVIIPEARMISVTGSKNSPESTHQQVNATDVWIESIRSGEQSPGSFANAAAVLETAQLASVALRARRKVLYDYKNMKVTNISEANNYLGRSEYREGWEI